MAALMPTSLVARAGQGALAQLAPAMLVLTVLYFLPVGFFLVGSFLGGDGRPTLAHYLRVFESSSYLTILGNTLRLALVTTVLTILVAYPVAYFLATSRRASRLLFLIVLPFWVSYLVRAFAWVVLLGRHGTVNHTLMALGITAAPIEIAYSFLAVVTGMVHAMLPLAVLTMLATMQTIPPSYGQAAAVLGARGGQSFFRVYLPLSLPGVTAAALMIFIIALGFFINPALLGSRRETVITQIIIDQLSTTLDWGFASAISMVLLAVTLVIVLAYQRVFGLTAITGLSEASAGRGIGVVAGLRRVGNVGLGAVGQAVSRLGRWSERGLAGLGWRGAPGSSRRLLVAFVALALVYLIVPILFLIPVSFSRSSFLTWPPELFTLRWYETYLTSPIWTSAIARSLIVATLTALIATALGTPAAFALVRRDIPAKSALMGLIVVPMILPHMIIAIALFSLYARIGLVGTIAGLVMGHVVLAIPFVVITVASVLRSYDRRLDQAAAVLGARPLRSFRVVTVPLIAMGLLSAFVFSFIVSFDELTVSLFITGGLTSTLPKQMWEDALNQVSPGLAAISTVMLVILTAVLALSGLIQKRLSWTGPAGRTTAAG